MSNLIEVDAKKVLNLFAELSGKNQQKVYKTALRKAAGILARETKKQLKQKIGSSATHKSSKYGSSLSNGIRVKINNSEEAKVHIMGDFRLKFFELGTKQRKLRKNGANRGFIKPLYFFRTAKQNKEQEIFSNIDQFISESIIKISKKYK